VLLEFLTRFRLPAVYYSRAGVRDGIIADLAARNVGAEVSRLNRDQRREVEQMGRRYQVSLEHGRKVAHIANLLFTALQPVHELPPAYGKLLEAAAYLHDVGHFVSNASHHKHSYYVVSNSDLAGFTDRERLLIAGLCRYHRKALPSAEHSAYQALTAEERRELLMMIPILRLADNLDRGRGEGIQGAECKVRDGQVVIQIQARGDIDLEQWSAERAGDAFQQIYNRSLSVVKAKE
jgi:exopolyphosphatase/guanosine-5'-triphosphate,3'-diphosphate pyrophosphatase